MLIYLRSGDPIELPEQFSNTNLREYAELENYGGY